MSEVDREDVAGMVRACRPDWTLHEFEESEFGTDFVAFVDCETPDGTREAVLKATTADFVAPEVARAEPRLFEQVGRKTSIPVPAVYGYLDAHDEYPAPFYLVERRPGENLEGRVDDLSPEARDRVVRNAGANIAELHEMGRLTRVGTVGTRHGELAVLDGEHGPVDDFREWFRAGVEDTLDALPDGGFFPEMADDADRFADLVDPLREELDARIAALPEPDPPHYCHWDYRYGNLLVDPETGETHAVLDWANLSATDPAYNLAAVESHLFDPERDGAERAGELRALFRDAYEAGRDDWAFTPAVEQRIETYLLAKRVDAMACLPLWLEDASAEAKREREREHRAFLDRYL
ncbi:phosphotransferase family protein [Halorarius halobius]|uniref:phosphotransferase family protein n=1 Tax=Halorarius halobius TaxID=2962671 RepID=UPI0020CF5F02|nr:phosphotransferase [Halorarius halobius]